MICWFSRKQYGGSTTKRIESNFPRICEQCYFVDLRNKPEKLGEQHDAQIVFNHMRRPEIYIEETL